MFTVKLHVLRCFPGDLSGKVDSETDTPDVAYRTQTTLVEAKRVTLHELRPNELYEVCGDNSDGEHFAFYVANPAKPLPDNILPTEGIFFTSCFIENSRGATSERIKWDF